MRLEGIELKEIGLGKGFVRSSRQEVAGRAGLSISRYRDLRAEDWGAKRPRGFGSSGHRKPEVETGDKSVCGRRS